MDVYQTEEQQVDAIKKYWKDNGNAIIAGLVIGFSGFIGFNYYKDSQETQNLMVSESFQSIMEASGNGQDENAFVEAGEKFIAENGSSSYASLTALALAKQASTYKDWPLVEKHLSTAIEKATDAGIKSIASLRLARVQVQQASYDKALATLSGDIAESFKASVEEVKGDIYLKQDKKDLARTAYQSAIDAGGLALSSSLQMKLDDLAVAVNLPE